MRGSVLRVRIQAGLSVAGLIALVVGCGGSDHVSSASLKPRLFAPSSIPGFGLERTLDWSDPINLVAEGFFLPQATHPTTAISFVKSAGFEGAAGEVLRKGSGLSKTEITLGVAKFKSADAANKVRDWMHGQDMQQPCFSECVFSPLTVPVPGDPSIKFVVQTAPAPSAPPGAPAPPKGAKIPAGVKIPEQEGVANYKFEFTKGPYLYFASLQSSPSDKAQIQTGAKRYFEQAKD